MASPARRVAWLLALAAAVIIVGVGGGYLAAGLARHDASPAPAAAGHDHTGHTPGGHVMPDGTTMAGGQAMTAPVPSATASASADMGGMDMDGMDMSGGSDKGGSDMGGMDMGGHAGHDGRTPATTTTTHRPRAFVLGTFGAVNGGVLLSAAWLRRRSPARRRTRSTTR